MACGETLMICSSCRVQHHEDCKGDTWCDCQHRVKQKTVVITGRFEPTVKQEPNGNR